MIVTTITYSIDINELNPKRMTSEEISVVSIFDEYKSILGDHGNMFPQ